MKVKYTSPDRHTGTSENLSSAGATVRENTKGYSSDTRKMNPGGWSERQKRQATVRVMCGYDTDYRKTLMSFGVLTIKRGLENDSNGL